MANAMTPEHRAATDVPPGYKRTEVGVIPEDWKKVRLGDVAEVIMGQSPVGSTYNTNGFGTPLINGPTEFTDKYPIKIQWTTQPTKICKPGDLLICVRGSSTGRMNFADDEYCLGRGVAAIRGRENSNTKFLADQVGLGIGKVLALSVGSTFPNVDGKAIRSIKIALPSLPEQRAIAEVLSDVDELITALDKLIAKKRDIKQAAMQQLLTGKTRLPGFSGEWKTKRLGEMGRFLKGSGVTRDDANSGRIPCVRYGEIYTTHNDYIRKFHSWISATIAATATPLEYGDILFAGSGETKEEIGKCVAFVIDTKAYAGGDIVILRPRNVNSLFLGYALNTPEVNRQKSSRGQGDAVVHINATALAQVRVPLPPLEEQGAIATVLSDMDAEIEALEKRRNKIKQIKQGMMQQLLTGRIRLVQPDPIVGGGKQ